MKASLTALIAILLTGFTAASASAQAPYYGPPQAPDMCGPGFWAMNNCGAWYGPNYCVRPGYLPFNGMVSVPPGKAVAGMPYNGPAGQQPYGQQPYGPQAGPMGYAGGPGPAVFPSQRAIRSPRDFFMYGEERQYK